MSIARMIAAGLVACATMAGVAACSGAQGPEPDASAAAATAVPGAEPSIDLEARAGDEAARLDADPTAGQRDSDEVAAVVEGACGDLFAAAAAAGRASLEGPALTVSTPLVPDGGEGATLVDCVTGRLGIVAAYDAALDEVAASLVASGVGEADGFRVAITSSGSEQEIVIVPVG